jgi:cytochrome c55X
MSPSPSLSVIASEAKRSPAARRAAEIASSRTQVGPARLAHRFLPIPGKPGISALLAMTAFLMLSSLPVTMAADGDVDQGHDTYQDLCSTCHGRDMVNSGALSFDLRKFPKDDFARFRTSVLNGKGTAMPAWAGKVSDEDVTNLWAYVRSGG